MRPGSEPYNNPGTNCTAPMTVDEIFDSRVVQDVATMYEGRLGVTPDELACGKNESGGPRWEFGQPCRSGLFRMMLDPSTNSTYTNWQSNFENWMNKHLAGLERSLATLASGPWNFTAIPPDWSGIAYWDLEVKPVHAAYSRLLRLSSIAAGDANILSVCTRPRALMGSVDQAELGSHAKRARPRPRLQTSRWCQ